MAQKKVKIYFLDLSRKGEDKALAQQEIKDIFGHLENKILKKSTKENHVENSRVKKNDDNYFYLITNNDDSSLIAKHNKYILGIFAKDRHFNYPYKSNETCQLVRLPFINDDDDKNAITETTFFLVNPKLSVILWLSNRNVSSYTKLEEYLNFMIADCENINFDVCINPLIRTSSFTRLLESNALKAIEFTYTGQITGINGILATLDKDIDVVETSENKEIPIRKIQTKITLDQSCKGIMEKGVSFINAIKRLREKDCDLKLKATVKNSEDVTKLPQQTNKKVNDQTKVIDLIEDKYVVTSTLRLEGKYNDVQRVHNLLINNMDRTNEEIKKDFRL